MFEFVFQGTYEQYEFFKYIAVKKIPGCGLFLDNYVGDEFHCSMNDDSVMIFKMGMIVSACYAKFKRLKESEFDN
jgi:hypothetical protein